MFLETFLYPSFISGFMIELLYQFRVLPDMEIPFKVPQDDRVLGLLDDLFRSIGWRERGPEKWKEVLDNSRYCAYVITGNSLVGFGRIVEDGVMCMFYDIAIHPDHQTRGLGRELMSGLIAKVRDKDYASIGLFTWEQNPGNVAFYESLGFERVPTGMELTRYMRRE